MNSSQRHWEEIYAHRDPRLVSWYEPVPQLSLELIDDLVLARDAAIIDVGGGTSSLAQALLQAGYTEITVADISSSSIQRATAQLGDDASRITWVQADVRSHDFGRRYELWHDRAVLHFMVDPADRDCYLSVLRRTLRADGHAILATFGPDGPTSCSGLPVDRYDASQLARVLAPDFEVVSSRLHDHQTPGGARQQFLYLHAHHTSEL
jgi:2-polyprenyl-3-methyl-5-hydroxy-6-metoxy-1,4-benzoquinol methylase